MYTTKNAHAKRRFYDDRRANMPKDHCPFCTLADDEIDLLKGKSKNFIMLENKFPYDFWDMRGVEEHLMLIPRRHIANLSDFNDQEMRELNTFMTKYDDTGYNIYFRTPTSEQRSQEHQHTHFIKNRPGMKRFVVYLKKPYITIVK